MNLEQIIALGFRVLPIAGDGTKKPRAAGFGKGAPDFTCPATSFGPDDLVGFLTGPCPALGDDWLAVLDVDGTTTFTDVDARVGEPLPATLSSKHDRHRFYRIPPSEARAALRAWVRLLGRKADDPEVDLKLAGGYAIEKLGPDGWFDVPFDPDAIAVLPTTWIRRVLEIRNAKPASPAVAGRDDGTRVDMGAVPLDVVDALAAVWPQQGEGCHDAALALGGILGDSHWTEDDIARFSGALFMATGTKDRTVDVLYSVGTRRSGGEAMGWPTLKAIMNNGERGRAAGTKGVDAALKKMKEGVPGLRAPKIQLPNLDAQGKVIHTGAKAQLALNIGSATEVADDIIQKELDGVVFAEGKFWRCTDGQIWSEIPRPELVRSVMAYDGVVYDLTDRGREIKLKVSSGFTSSVIDLLGARLDRPDFFRHAKIGALFACGTFVGLTGPESCTPDHRCRSRLAVQYGKAPVPRCLAAMRDWFAGTSDASQRVAALFEHLGMSIVGAWAVTNNPGGTVLLGEGANGKSVWLEVVRGVMPHGTVSSVPPQEFAREYSRAGLIGSRINICTEIPERQILASGHMKAIFSYEMVTGRLPYGQPFDFTPQCGHIFSCNALPATEDQSAGFWRRWKVIRFPNRFEGSKANPQLAREILDNEAQGVVYYAVEAALAAVKRGFLTIPDSSTGELDSWRTATDHVAEFAHECLAAAPELPKKEWMGINTLYQSFKAWCQTAGHERPMTRRRFRERMLGLRFLEAKTEAFNSAFAVRMHGGPIAPPSDPSQFKVLKGGKQ